MDTVNCRLPPSTTGAAGPDTLNLRSKSRSATLMTLRDTGRRNADAKPAGATSTAVMSIFTRPRPADSVLARNSSAMSAPAAPAAIASRPGVAVAVSSVKRSRTRPGSAAGVRV